VLWVLCLDEATFDVLTELDLEGVRLVRLADVESPELLAIKGDRSRIEYYWTLTPSTPKLVFERDPSVERVTYLDADLYFLKSPAAILNEFDESGGSVLVTEHAYDPIYDRSKTHGRFCVQFVTFVRDRSEHIRSSWEDQCIEWCYARREEGRYGDQKYLDEWPALYGEEVYVLEARHLIMAPWNARVFPWESAAVWHFHGLRLLGAGRVRPYRDYHVPERVLRNVYDPYIEVLRTQSLQLGFDVVQASRRPFHDLASSIFNQSLGMGRRVRIAARHRFTGLPGRPHDR
jgi:hypothetical protein